MPNRLELDYFIVDVFTETPLAGNPLAVVFDTAGLATERMQSLAREFNLSETTFIERRSAEVEKVEGVRVRIFTTQEELPFAGHPTLGTAHVLKAEAPETVKDGTVTLALNVGPVPVSFTAIPSASGASYGEMTQRDPQFGALLDPAAVARLAGLAGEDLNPTLPPQVVSTGNAFAIVVLRTAESLGRLRVDQHQAAAWLGERGARWFYIIAPVDNPQDHGAREYRARMQFNGGEDPATGSAAGCAISYLVAHNAAPSGETIHLRQGVEIGRPSDLYLSARRHVAGITNVRVGGSTSPVAKGRIFLP